MSLCFQQSWSSALVFNNNVPAFYQSQLIVIQKLSLLHFHTELYTFWGFFWSFLYIFCDDYLETQLLTTLDPVSDWGWVLWSNQIIIMVILSQEFFPYLPTVFAQHMSKICSHSWLNTILSLWADLESSLCLMYATIASFDIASQTPSVATTMNSHWQSRWNVCNWGTALMTCFHGGFSVSDLRRKSPKLRVGIRTPPTLE